ncbi:hypothetical protein O181_057694, partial [Austropuccinia psidii MF-1]|nr:hypothetical protein [Austropuccinia psidii MF-1]
MTERDHRELSQIITHGRRLTIAQVTNLMTHTVSTQTIQQEIHKLALAQAHCHWTINEWARFIWTDESAFKLGKKVDQVQVWRTPQEKWNLENLAVNHQLGRQTLMVWGAFCAAMRAPLVFLNDRMTSTKMVQQVYQPGLLPFIAWMEQAPWIRGRHRLLLMEDNCPSKHQLAKSARYYQTRLASTFSRLEPNQECLEGYEEPN